MQTTIIKRIPILFISFIGVSGRSSAIMRPGIKGNDAPTRITEIKLTKIIQIHAAIFRKIRCDSFGNIDQLKINDVAIAEENKKQFPEKSHSLYP